MVHPQTTAMLARLERQELDRLRQGLAEIDHELSQLFKASSAAQDDFAALMARRGMDVPLDVAHGLSLGTKLRQQEIATRISELQLARETIHDKLMVQLVEVKHWDLASDKARKKLTERQTQREQKRMDEQVLTRHARR